MDLAQTNTSAPLSAEVLKTLVELSEEINSSLALDEVLQKVSVLVKTLVDYEIFAVLLLEERTQKLYFRFAIGHPPEVVENWQIPLGQGITGRAAVTRQPVLVGDVSKDPHYISAVETVRSELAIPLVVKDRTIGVLDISSHHLNYFTPEQQSILSLLASRLAIAIENARLFERAREQAETLLLLHDVARDAGAILDVEAQLRRVAELAKRVIDYQIFSILLYDEKENVFRQRINVKFGERKQEKFAIPATVGIVGAAAATKEPVIVADVTSDPRYFNENPETRSELAIPLIHKGRVIGVLDLESPQLNYFNDDHVQTLSILAAHLAVSLENAGLYEQVARDEARLERELQAAQRIQGSLLPSVPGEDTGLEIAARYVSARVLGGDIYDFIRYGPQQLAVALGDVSGKGTAAALYGAIGIGVLRSLAQHKMQPAAMLRQLNHLLCERRIDDRFMTLCYATWQKGRRRLRVANAGQSQPLLWKNGRCDKIDVAGLPLGILDDATYTEWATTLDPGDILVFYSDGFSETANSQGEFFGTDRLRDLIAASVDLSASQLADRILNEVEEFSASARAVDDRTLVVLKVKPDSLDPVG
jgi:sigma-B regulation protein RsbU (phosphoserine phosphatase)